MARGGYRKPAQPAPVSGPGELSKRTDGKQPVTVASGGAYGSRQASAQQQAAAPLPVVSPLGGSVPQAPTVMSRPGGPGAFGPTQRPWEDPTAGLRLGSEIPEDPHLLIRALVQLYPHPDLVRLLGS